MQGVDLAVILAFTQPESLSLALPDRNRPRIPRDRVQEVRKVSQVIGHCLPDIVQLVKSLRGIFHLRYSWAESGPTR